jgi:hypothetical protein
VYDPFCQLVMLQFMGKDSRRPPQDRFGADALPILPGGLKRLLEAFIVPGSAAPQPSRQDRMAAQTHQHSDGVFRNGGDVAAGRSRILLPVLLEWGFHKMSRSAFRALELIGLDGLDIHVSLLAAAGEGAILAGQWDHAANVE